MAKPDLQPVFARPSDGQLKQLKGKLGLAVSSLDQLPAHADDSAADTAGLAIGELYRTGSVVKVRVA